MVLRRVLLFTVFTLLLAVNAGAACNVSLTLSEIQTDEGKLVHVVVHGTGHNATTCGAASVTAVFGGNIDSRRRAVLE